MSTVQAHSVPPRLAPGTRLGAVHVVVSDLERSLVLYRDVLGLHVHRREDGLAALGAGAEDVVVLHEQPGARRAGRHAGLYHVALLYPTREELGRVAMRLAASRTPIQGASDHGTHEAIYLADPDGNGLELAWDRARDAWPSYEDMYGSGPHPLDLTAVLEVGGEELVASAAPGLRTGHLHLHVGDVAAATRFYRDGLGFEVMADLGTAVFLSAGGYHHHVAANVWRGRGVPPVPQGTVGMDRWTVVADGPAELDAVRARLAGIGVQPDRDDASGLLVSDPSGNAVLVVAESGA
jgi:catechol 2,3-dioxygenase